MSDVIVVGGGPAGASATIELARAGASVVLLDRDTFPRDKTCGSGLSPNAIAMADRLGVGVEVRERAYPIQSVKIVTPGGREMVLASNAAAVVLLRRDFDELLVRRAQALGATLRDGVRASALLREGERVVGVRTADGEELRARYVLCADGSHSIFSSDSRPKPTISTLMGWWEDVATAPGQLEMIFDHDLMPLYGWLFPESDRRVNIGICMEGQEAGGGKATRNVRQVFDMFLARHYSARLRGARQVGRFKGHPIVYTRWVDHCTAPGAMYIGESARLTNYATGEGISQAMHSGALAAGLLADVLGGRRSEASAMREYVWRLRARFAMEFGVATAVRGAVRSRLLDGIAAAFGNPRVRRAVVGVLGSALAGAPVQATGER
ncbi:MAG: NAD(P)/FAD-dependent oxidoreductase [Polyangiaceae bacterium]|nr:NAD(P)/FAD-dependent oxidoreductase [Polyangiaceae bacterium]